VENGCEDWTAGGRSKAGRLYGYAAVPFPVTFGIPSGGHVLCAGAACGGGYGRLSCLMQARAAFSEMRPSFNLLHKINYTRAPILPF